LSDVPLVDFSNLFLYTKQIGGLMNRYRVVGWVSFAFFGAAIAMAQAPANINVNLTFGNTGGPNWSNTLTLAQTGSAGSLGNATLVMTSNSGPIGNNGPMGPVQVTLELAFNQIDTIAISFTESDPNFASPTTVTMSGGTITGGTGAYAERNAEFDRHGDGDVQ
jgi:hypothetical protein